MKAGRANIIQALIELNPAKNQAVAALHIYTDTNRVFAVEEVQGNMANLFVKLADATPARWVMLPVDEVCGLSVEFDTAQYPEKIPVDLVAFVDWSKKRPKAEKAN